MALVGVLFFTQLDHGSGSGVDEVSPGLHEQLTAVGMPASAQEDIVAGFRECVRDRSAATDPTEIPASCELEPSVSTSPAADEVRQMLTQAGALANAHNFSRTFSFTLWYAAGILVIVFVGLFALPRRVRARDLDAELSPAGT